MKKLSSRGVKWLKILHIYSVSVWIGCATLLAIIPFSIKPQDGKELYGILWTLDFLDQYILAAGGMGTLATGLVFSVWTNWGWFKHKWIIIKWIICIFGIIFGTFWLGGWMKEMAHIAHVQGLNALTDLRYISNRQYIIVLGDFQLLTLLFALVISTLKPWKKKKRLKNLK